ncbi:hypothetical protein D791_02801 [Nitrincola nitratireducens]|uniref:Uncharacterized protein n=1 Tax=Nitrincola nitratireducens TaxID=1229521 RepID=W9USN7_9GAMM|nr:hypothetical protein D791_02801 [Nitrincola nitratireducens]
MRESGRLLIRFFEYLDGFIEIGILTMDINGLEESYITDQMRARPVSEGQCGKAKVKLKKDGPSSPAIRSYLHSGSIQWPLHQMVTRY